MGICGASLLVQTGLLFSWGSAMDEREMILSNANEREVIPTCVYVLLCAKLGPVCKYLYEPETSI